MAHVFITGGTGYTGKRLIKKLVARGHEVTALVRPGSETKLPRGVRGIIADPFDSSTFVEWVPKGGVFVQLLGVAHPSPRKKDQFREIDLRSVKASADAAIATGISHFVYVSVAMAESKRMKEFQQVRSEGEAYLRLKGLRCTFVRPRYVLGPGHWWPLVLLPLHGFARFVPAWRQKAKAFALVTIGQMVATLVRVVESAPQPLRVVEIRNIKKRKP